MSYLYKQPADNKAKGVENEQKVAATIRRKSLETFSESKKCESESSDLDVPVKRRNNGNETVSFLREKSQSNYEIRNKEFELKQQELELQKQREENANQCFEQLILQSQQQNQALMLFIAKLADKL